MKKDTLKYPILVTRGLVVFPSQFHQIDVGRSKSLAAIEEAKNSFGNFIVILPQKNPHVENPRKSQLHNYGTLCKINEITNQGKNNVILKVKGLERVVITEFDSDENKFVFGEIQKIDDQFGDRVTETAYMRAIIKTLEEITSKNKTTFFPSREFIEMLSAKIGPIELINSLGNILSMPIEKKVKLLGEPKVNKRLEEIIRIIDFEKEIHFIEEKISKDVKGKMSLNQREYYLRERIRAIQAELGELENGVNEIDLYKDKVKNLKAPKNIIKKINEEISKLEKIPSSSAEYSVVRSYLEVVFKLPWKKETKDNEDLKKITKTLNTNHFGLEKVKERIIEYIAVKQKTKSLKAPILCLVGPPGVGKTSLAYSIADGLKRNFVKMSLGGVKDESEIRGHRRTYLGSMPGRIIKGMEKAKVVNPVFLLDEIDKMASDYKGDPASAMLEVLDPEQNKEFSDHYLEESYDLSKVMFIATANYLWNIPSALRDRLEVIFLSSYTENEKLKISKEFLIPKSIKNHGLKAKEFLIDAELILYIIRHYTKEAGVRSMERILDKISRKKVVEIAKNKFKAGKLTKKDIQKYLGPIQFDYSLKEARPQVGVVTGLAYTQFGGDILPIEVNYFPGKGNMVITGMIGEVMKESSKIALSYVRSNAKKYKIKNEMFTKNDIHIHIPEGAIPKDGPSAGITITTAIISALTNTPVKKDVAMTGEINLRGHVLPIGGLKEKAISANRSGIKTIIIPKKNKKDLINIPKETKKELEIILVSKLDEVLKKAF